MSLESIAEKIKEMSDSLKGLSESAAETSELITQVADKTSAVSADPVVMALTVFALACFVGYYVVWKVTPALHSPLMAVTNAISSVIIVGALLAMSVEATHMSKTFGFIAVILASINIFGGFMVTQRMLSMFSKSK